MLEIRKSDDSSSLNLIITGDVSVSQIGELQTSLMSVPMDASNYHFQIEKIENLDLSFFQLLLAFTRKLLSLNKRLNFEWNLVEEYRRIMEESGFSNVFNELQSI